MKNFIHSKPSRSDKYQYKIREVQYSNDLLGAFNNRQSLNPFDYNEDYLNLKDQLLIRTKELMKVVLTPKQHIIMSMIMDGYTQQEVATAVGVNQSSITKAIFGNTTYKGERVQYGGIVKKLSRLLNQDETIILILDAMREASDDDL